MSFRLKIILGVASIQIMLLTIIVGSSLHNLRMSNQEEIFRRGQITAELLASATADAIIATDLATLDSILIEAIHNDVVYVRIRNNGDIILSEAGDKGVLETELITDTSISDLKDQRLDLEHSIYINGEYIGRVELGLSTTKLNAVVRENTRWMLTVSTAGMFAIVLFGYGLGTILTTQLSELRKSARRVASGEFGIETHVKGKDELADAARSFNKMSKALAIYAKEVEAARKQAEEGKLYAETLLFDAMNSASQGVVILDSKLSIEFVNDAFRDMYPSALDYMATGMPYVSLLEKLKLIEKPLPDLLKENDNKQNPRLGWLENGQDSETLQTELSDGRHILHTRRSMSNGGYVVIDTEITEFFKANEKNRRLELEIMQTGKMEALGTLASGIAHEINTPVQFIGDNIRFLTDCFADVLSCIRDIQVMNSEKINGQLESVDWDYLVEEIPPALNEALSGVQTIGRIVSSVKEFSHPEQNEKTFYDINELIENAKIVSRPQWRHDAIVNIVIPENIEKIPCYPGDLGQVLINLIVNAADAIRENLNQTEGEITIKAKTDYKEATITVSDNGPGIPDEIKDRIFDLFFTTKDPGKGTGQGLAICKSIIEIKHSGKLHVTSKAGLGTTFTITLPMKNVSEEMNNKEVA
jgi:signal transduction histidine kinase/HAMP domain-containing protein